MILTLLKFPLMHFICTYCVKNLLHNTYTWMQKLAILFRGSGFQIDEISGDVSTSYITKINLGSIHE